MTSLKIEKLHRSHNLDTFDCGQPDLNRFLVRFALQNQQAGASQTYLAIANESEAIGYYTLVVGQVSHEEAPARIKKGLARHPVPIMLLARLAIGKQWHGRGLGSGLLKDAMKRTLQAADIVGIRAFAVHAKDDQAIAFYEHFDFIASPSDPYHLFVLLKHLASILG
ncbi:MAG: GNAT family N-acetyltransferase [Bryobacteraceae bacterium]